MNRATDLTASEASEPRYLALAKRATGLTASVREPLLSQVKSRSPSQIHRAGRQAGAIKQVRRAGWEWAASCSPSAKSCVGWVYVRRCAYKHFSHAPCCEGPLRPVSLTQRGESQRTEVQYRVSVSGRSVTHLHSPFSSPCRTLSRRATRGRALKPPCRCWALGD